MIWSNLVDLPSRRELRAPCHPKWWRVLQANLLPTGGQPDLVLNVIGISTNGGELFVAGKLVSPLSQFCLVICCWF